jgi:Initiator Replication protein
MADAGEIKNSPILNKANSEIGYFLREGKLSPASCRLLNILSYSSIEQLKKRHEPGYAGVRLSFDSPILVDVERYFWCSANELMTAALMKKDKKNFVAVMDSIIGLRVTRSEGPSIFVGNLLTAFTIAPVSGVDYLGWEFQKELAEYIMRPAAYTPINLYYQGQFGRNLSALKLYEICRRYLTSEFHVTKTETWQTWQNKLIGELTPRGEFGQFNRDFLKPAIALINSKTDILIRLCVTKTGSYVSSASETKLYFDVSSSDNGILNPNPTPTPSPTPSPTPAPISVRGLYSSDGSERPTPNPTAEPISEQFVSNVSNRDISAAESPDNLQARSQLLRYGFTTDFANNAIITHGAEFVFATIAMMPKNAKKPAGWISAALSGQYAATAKIRSDEIAAEKEATAAKHAAAAHDVIAAADEQLKRANAYHRRSTDLADKAAKLGEEIYRDLVGIERDSMKNAYIQSLERKKRDHATQSFSATNLSLGIAAHRQLFQYIAAITTTDSTPILEFTSAPAVLAPTVETNCDVPFCEWSDEYLLEQIFE